MAASSITSIDTSDIFIAGNPFAKRYSAATLLTIGARTTVMTQYTLLGKIAATGKWAPYDPTATNGVAMSMGIYMGEELTAAAIAAADVTDLDILYADAFLDEDKLVIEGATTLDTVIGTGVTAVTVRDALVKQGIVFRSVDSISAAQR